MITLKNNSRTRKTITGNIDLDAQYLAKHYPARTKEQWKEILSKV